MRRAFRHSFRGAGHAEWTPANVTGLIRAWDFGALSGSDLTSVPAAWGATGALTLGGTSGSPDAKVNWSPNRRHMLETTRGNNEVGTFTSTGALSAGFTVACVFAPKDASASMPIIGGPSTAYLQLNASGGRFFQFGRKTDSTSASTTNIADAANYLWPGGCYLIVITMELGALMTFYVNGVAVATTSGGAAAAYTFDRLFRQAAAATYGSGFFEKVAIWNRPLSAGEVALLNARWASSKAGRIYLSQAGDDTTGYGFSEATPRKTVAAAIIFGGVAQRTGISLKRGETWINDPISPSFVTSGISAADRFVFDAWGDTALVMPRMWGFAPTTGWVDVGGGLWTKTGITANPRNVFYTVDLNDKTEASVIKMVSRATSQQWSYSWDDPSDTLTVRLDDFLNPNVVDVRISTGTTRGYDSPNDNHSVRDISFRYWGDAGFYGNGADLEALRCEISWCSNDGFSGHGQRQDCKDGWQVGNGSIVVGSGAGDGTTYHSNSTGVVSGNYIAGNRLGGCRNEQYTAVQIIGNTIRGNGNDIVILAQGSGSGAKSTIVTGNLIQVTAASLTGYAIELADGVPAGSSLTATGNQLQSIGSVRPKAVNAPGGAFVDGGGNALSQFSSLL